MSALNEDLYDAAFSGHAEEIKKIVESGVDVNATDWDNNTALTIATKGDHTDAVKALLQCGAKTEIEAKQEHTALEIAYQRGNEEIIDILVKAGKYTKTYLKQFASKNINKIEGSTVFVPETCSTYYCTGTKKSFNQLTNVVVDTKLFRREYKRAVKAIVHKSKNKTIARFKEKEKRRLQELKELVLCYPTEDKSKDMLLVTVASLHIHNDADALLDYVSPCINKSMGLPNQVNVTVTHTGFLPGLGRVVIVPEISQPILSTDELEVNGVTVSINEEGVPEVSRGSSQQVVTGYRGEGGKCFLGIQVVHAMVREVTEVKEVTDVDLEELVRANF